MYLQRLEHQVLALAINLCCDQFHVLDYGSNAILIRYGSENMQQVTVGHGVEESEVERHKLRTGDFQYSTAFDCGAATQIGVLEKWQAKNLGKCPFGHGFTAVDVDVGQVEVLGNHQFNPQAIAVYPPQYQQVLTGLEVLQQRG